MVENLTVDYKPSTHDDQGHLKVSATTHLGPFFFYREIPLPGESDESRPKVKLADSDLTKDDDIPDFDPPHSYGEGAGRYQTMAAQILEKELERWLATRS